MHNGNRRWLASLKSALPAYFDGASVLEIGSYNVNGSARDYFKGAARYVGVDHCAGPGVDVVAEARATDFSKVPAFDTLVYLSVFEHDPAWRAGFEQNLKWLRNGALLIVGWGAEGNLRHGPEPWAPVPARDVLTAAKSWDVIILDSFFEEDRFGKDTPGAYDLLMLKV